MRAAVTPPPSTILCNCNIYTRSYASMKFFKSFEVLKSNLVSTFIKYLQGFNWIGPISVSQNLSHLYIYRSTTCSIIMRGVTGSAKAQLAQLTALYCVLVEHPLTAKTFGLSTNRLFCTTGWNANFVVKYIFSSFFLLQKYPTTESHTKFSSRLLISL